MMFTYLPEIVCIVGLVIYSQTPEPRLRVVEIGRLMFFAGLLATLLIGIHRP